MAASAPRGKTVAQQARVARSRPCRAVLSRFNVTGAGSAGSIRPLGKRQMRLFAPLRCSANRHRPTRQEVSWNGEHYCGTCADCGNAIHRVARGKWRVDQLGDHRLL